MGNRGLLFAMVRLVWVILAFCGFGQAFLDGEVCPRRHHALLIALLPIHGGLDCRELLQKGVQQKVALEAAVEDVNTEYDLQIALKVQDTCSTREKAVEAAVEGVAFAKKRCSKFPVFLGFVGPDDEESLRGILGVLDYPQVVPATERSFQHSAISVDVINSDERARRISMFLRYLNWYSFILIFTTDTISSRIAASLLESDFCLINTVLRIPSFASGPKDRSGIKEVKRAVEGVQNVRIVILTDDADVMGYFTDYAEEEWGGFKYVVYTQTSGILPWRSSKRMSRNTIILHEAPKSPLILPDFEDVLRNSTLWSSYSNQLGTTCEGCRPGFLIDPTVVPYVYSVHLFSRALRTATRRKCGPILICDALKKMSPTEWKAILEDTITVAESHKINFYTVLDSQINIILPGENTTDLVGYIHDELILHRPGVLRRLNRTKSKQCLVDMYEYELERDDVTTTKPLDSVEKATEEKIPINFGYSELLATVIGFPIALVTLIALTIVCASRSLRSSTDNPGKSALSADTPAEDYS